MIQRFFPKTCPHCGGDRYDEEDGRDIVRVCIQCGRRAKVGEVTVLPRPAAPGHFELLESRYNSIQSVYFGQGLAVNTIAVKLEVSESTVWRAIARISPGRKGHDGASLLHPAVGDSTAVGPRGRGR